MDHYETQSLLHFDVVLVTLDDTVILNFSDVVLQKPNGTVIF